MHKSKIFILIFMFVNSVGMSQKASVYIETINMKSYLFGDPNPVAEISRIYPYHRFDSYSSKSIDKDWEMVVLENDYIKVYICPEIGGKIWGAIEKSTGKEFIYFNHVVKFRDVAMRGAWTSGGIEYNFGDIGHIPTCATPVDYTTKKYPNGSVSCTVGAIDLPSGTKWNVEIRLQPKHAFFETKVSWFNNTALPCTYYHWMNAAAKSSGNLEFIYPGNKRIGHGGELGEWPMEDGRAINYYDNNDFGFYKSYHIINSYSDFFGGYWHDDDFGFGHWSNYDDKPGKKIWIWGLSQQGMIWEDLLSDNDGQYIEFQSGKLFNQAANSSTFTPFKHKEFLPHDVDIMYEIWFPLKETKGMIAASKYVVLNYIKDDENPHLLISALQEINDTLNIQVDGEPINKIHIKLKPLEKKVISFQYTKDYSIQLSDNKLFYSSKPDDVIVDRPTKTTPDFNWESTYGLYIRAYEMEKQRRFNEAMEIYEQALQKDAGFLPALNKMALAHYRKMDYTKALKYISKALSIDTYDNEANYLYGLINKKLRNIQESKSGFSIATASVKFRVAAYIELAKLFLQEQNYISTINYSKKALNFSSNNPVALQLTAISYRKTNRHAEARQQLNKLHEIDATNHFIAFEEILLSKDVTNKNEFIKNITNEMPEQSLLDLAIFYAELACNKESVEVLKSGQTHPVKDIWLSSLDYKNTDRYIERLLNTSPYMVFTYREATSEILKSLIQTNNHWKLKYYQGLIYWNKGLKNKTKELFEACKEEPDFVPFYLAKSKLSTNAETIKALLLKAFSLNKNDWRAALELINYYLEHNEGKKALFLSKEFKNKYPEQTSLGLSYAQSLMKVNKYEDAVKFLNTYNLLPFEGATVGRDIYHEACIRLALKAMANNKHKDAILWSEKAKKWPVNLGVGRPYDVDERLDNYIIAQSYEKLNKTDSANYFFEKIVNHPNKKYINESSKLLLQLLAKNRLSKSNETNQLLLQRINNEPENEYLLWVKAKYENLSQKAKEIEIKILSLSDKLQPYDTQFIDKEFQLLIDCLIVFR